MYELLLLLWIVVIFVFVIIEYLRLHGDFTAFAIGGIGGLVCYLLGYDLIIQVAAFVVLSVVCFLALRPAIKRLMQAHNEKQVAGFDFLIGEKGVVTQKVDADGDTGRVAVAGHDCLARAKNPKMKYNVADKIIVVDTDGGVLIVEK